jgi:hypothetical protein
MFIGWILVIVGLIYLALGIGGRGRFENTLLKLRVSGPTGLVLVAIGVFAMLYTGSWGFWP